MKNKLIFLNTLLFFCSILVSQIALGNELKFESKTIDTINNDTVIASGDIKITDNYGQFITADRLEFNKIKKIYKITGNIYFEDKVENKILSENLIIDENNEIYTFENDVVIRNEINSMELKTNKIEYNQKDNTIFSEGLTKLNKDNKFFIESADVIYNKKDNIFIFDNKSLIRDNLGNSIEIDNFKFFLNKNQLIAFGAKIIDKEQNIYEIEQMNYDLNEKKIYGKDIIINKDNKISKKKYLPRSKK